MSSQLSAHLNARASAPPPTWNPWLRVPGSRVSTGELQAEGGRGQLRPAFLPAPPPNGPSSCGPGSEAPEVRSEAAFLPASPPCVLPAATSLVGADMGERGRREMLFTFSGKSLHAA